MSTQAVTRVNPRAVLLADLFHHRWAVPALAELASGAAGGRVAPLMARLGASRPSLSRTLERLIGRRFVRRNPGYGHPLRPELLLTSRGVELGRWASRITAAVERHGHADAAYRKWTLAVLCAVHEGATRFKELEIACGAITPRALTQALGCLEEAGLVERIVYDDRPPSVRYAITRSGRALAKLARAVPTTTS